MARVSVLRLEADFAYQSPHIKTVELLFGAPQVRLPSVANQAEGEAASIFLVRNSLTAFMMSCQADSLKAPKPAGEQLSSRGKCLMRKSPTFACAGHAESLKPDPPGHELEDAQSHCGRNQICAQQQTFSVNLALTPEEMCSAEQQPHGT